jgi:hypothetical protein
MTCTLTRRVDGSMWRRSDSFLRVMRVEAARLPKA